MTLSKRRLQFLDQLVEMYQEQGFPVHYEALAKAIGVSKWTAYDMLKEIEKSGYVKRSYEVNSKETGRSQVVFTPTEKATGLLMHQRSTAASHENWEESLQSIQEMLTILKHTSMQDLMTKLLDEIPQGRTNRVLRIYFGYSDRMFEKGWRPDRILYSATYQQNIQSSLQLDDLCWKRVGDYHSNNE